MRTGTVLIALVTALSACSSGGGMSSSGTGGASNGGTGGAAGSGGPGGGGTAEDGGAGAGGGTAGTGATTGAGGKGGSGGAGTGGTAGAGGKGGSGGAGTGGTAGAGGTGGSGGAGTGGTAGAGGKAGTGGAGTGGTTGTGGSAGAGGSALACSGSLAQPTAPVTVAATLHCQTSSSIQQVSVGAASANSGFVSLLGDVGITPAFFFDVSPSSVQVQQLASADSNSLPTNASGTFGVVTGVVDRTTVSWSSRAGTGPGKLTATSVMDTMSSSNFIDGALGPDGTQYAVFARSDTTMALLSRPAGGTAFSVGTVYPMLTPYGPRLVVDASKAPHFLSWIPGQGLVDSPQGQTLVTLYPSTVQNAPPWRPTRPGGLDFAVSAILADDVHVLRRGTGSGFDDILVPGTPATNAPVSVSPFTCDGGFCSEVTQTGDFASSAALARASDGTLWLVTIRDHLDRTIPYKYTGGEACQCQATFVPADDHSTRTLAVQRISPGASAPSAILWSQALAPTPWASIFANDTILDVSFFGSSLFFTIVSSATTVSYYVLDTTAL